MGNYIPDLSQEYQLNAFPITLEDVIKESVKYLVDYQKCKEYEETKRKVISAKLRAFTYQIDVQKELCLKKLELQYKERSRLYDIFERCLKVALENSDKEWANKCNEYMITIYSQSLDLDSVQFIPSNNIGLLNE